VTPFVIVVDGQAHGDRAGCAVGTLLESCSF
jgi:hypothetical protein